jgi:hypothetical protein
MGVAAARGEAMGALLREIRQTGSLCEESLAWIRRNPRCLATGDVERLMDAVYVAGSQFERGLSTGGAIVK